MQLKVHQLQHHCINIAVFIQTNSICKSLGRAYINKLSVKAKRVKQFKDGLGELLAAKSATSAYNCQMKIPKRIPHYNDDLRRD